MFRSRFFKSFSALLLAASLTACQMPVSNPFVQRNTLQAQSAQRQIVQADAKIYSQPVPVSVEPHRLIFSGPQNGLKPGQVLMGRSLKDQDFLRRVRQIHVSGSQTVVDTLPATLFDAFEELDLSGSRIQANTPPIAMQSHRFNIGGVVDVVMDLNLKPDFSDTKIRLVNERLFVRVAPRFEMDSQIRTEFKFIGIKPVPENPLKPVGSVSFNALRIPAWIGPVPLVFHLKPGAGLDWGHQADGRVIVSTDIDGQFTASVEMEAGLGENPVTKTDTAYQLNGKMLPPELRLTGSAKARLHLPTIHLDTEFAGLVGPFVQAGAYVDGHYLRRLSATPQQTTIYTLANSHLGLRIDAGITPTHLFGKDLSKELRFKILDKQIKELYRKESTDVIPNTPTQPQ